LSGHSKSSAFKGLKTAPVAIANLLIDAFISVILVIKAESTK
jgi:hypothetical protein